MDDRVGSSDGASAVSETSTRHEAQGEDNRPGMDEERLGMERDRPGVEGDVATQLSQLQCMAREMKTGFSKAMEALQDIQYGDQQLEATVQHNKDECEQQLGDVVQMVLALKSEFGGVVAQLKLATETQQTLQRHVDLLQCERDILLEELERSGSISSQLRQKYHSGQDRPNGLNRSSDSTSLSALLERARNTFNTSGHHSSNSSSHLTSDHDSGVMNTYQPGGGDVSLCDEVTPPVMSPIVQSYIAGLQDSDQVEDIPLDENYDSDSSLTATINKSLDLGRSLSDKCAELTKIELSDEDTEETRDRQETKGEEVAEEERCNRSIQLGHLPSDGQPSGE
ncbi:hypothetical protein LSAT2_012035 [Lamellibrachia satsuma]|nr:hypothetical protein LSAT2_012035 [Lamellibrachia satsuma]